MLGGPLDRTPLNPRVTGTVERPGYRIEKVTFESRPRLYVTANLYVPAGTGRRPAILGPLGHSVNGKAWPSYQRLFSNLARKGYVVLAYDPFGQGERIEYPGSRPGQSALGGGTSEHEYAGRRLILLGANFGLFRAWDGIRGIDYLLTRAEVDPERIGCCGQSGGGTLTQFLAALDSRIRVAVVSMGNTENLAQDNVEPPGSADDAEQNIVPALARGIDRADLLYAFAPKPLLMTITLHDAGHTYSPEYVSSSRDLLDEYKRAYGLLGAGDRVSLQATTVSHGYVYEMRRATYAWFNRWFEMKNVDDDEPSQAVEPDATLFVTPTGFVTTSFGGETALSLTRQMADAIHTPPSLPADDVRSRIRSVLGDRGVARRSVGGPRPRHDQEAGISGRTVRVHERSGDSHTGLAAHAGQRRTLHAHPAVRRRGSGVELGRGGRVRRAAVRNGRMPRCGHRRARTRRLRDRLPAARTILFSGPHHRRSLPDVVHVDARQAAPRRTDLRHAAGARLSSVAAGRRRRRVARGRRAARRDRALRRGARLSAFAASRCAQTMTDYRSLAVAERYTQPFGIYAYGILREFDLPDVAGAVGPRPVLLLNPVTAVGEPAGAAESGSLQERSERHRSDAGRRRQSRAGSGQLGGRALTSTRNA